MAQDAGRRYARDENDLREAALEQLGHLQERMRGKTPEACFLWNEQRVSKTSRSGGKSTNPKSPTTSPYTSRPTYATCSPFARSKSTAPPQSAWASAWTCLCQAFDPDDPDPAAQFQIVIEVKGYWNDHLKNDLHDQLAADYMPKVGTHHGIYLVRYFRGPAPDPAPACAISYCRLYLRGR
jgi:hypothetical protein